MSRGASSPFTGLALSGFCMQISILLESAIPLYEGLKVMAEDSPVQREKEILTELSDKVRMGLPFHQAVREAGCFPAYVVNMSMLGERTGLLDTTMERLAVYYEKEYYLAENLRKAVTYPAMMILMLIIILFVLFTRVMPVFSGVYEQLGTSIPPAAAAAIRLGHIKRSRPGSCSDSHRLSPDFMAFRKKRSPIHPGTLPSGENQSAFCHRPRCC